MKTILKWTTPNDAYKSIYGEYSSSFTNETNKSNNQQEELGMIDLNPSKTLSMTS